MVRKMKGKKEDQVSRGDEIYERVLEKLMDENLDDTSFSEEEEDLIMKTVDLMKEKAFPNLERVGCPDSQVLRDMAFRREIAPEIAEEVQLHVWECAPCSYEIRAYAQEYEKTKGKARK